MSEILDSLRITLEHFEEADDLLTDIWCHNHPDSKNLKLSDEQHRRLCKHFGAEHTPKTLDPISTLAWPWRVAF